MYKLKVQISSSFGMAQFFVKVEDSDVHFFFDNTVITPGELSRFVSPRTRARYGIFFVNGLALCKVLKAVAL